MVMNLKITGAIDSSGFTALKALKNRIKKFCFLMASGLLKSEKRRKKESIKF
jgi:hypothetical protein